jgi:hypothetical protein
VPLEAVASKYYGESERLLAAVFTAGKDFPHGCLVFLDEIDALATERDSGMHEATRRVLSVLLRQVSPAGYEFSLPDRPKCWEMFKFELEYSGGSKHRSFLLVSFEVRDFQLENRGERRIF